MDRKKIFFSSIVMLFLTIIVYLFYSAPEKQSSLNEKTESELKYCSTDLFVILASVNDEARTLYTTSIVGGGKKAGLFFDEDWKSDEVEAGPLPALFLRETALLIEQSPIQLGLYLGSDYPISEANKFTGYQSEIFAELKSDNAPKYFFDKSSNRNVAMFPDLGTSMACINCHNNHEQSPKKDWELNDIMGATTWSTPIDSLTTDELLEYVAVFKTSALDVYSIYLNKVRSFKKNQIPLIGNKWPSQGYFLPDEKEFKDSLENIISKQLLNEIYKSR